MENCVTSSPFLVFLLLKLIAWFQICNKGDDLVGGVSRLYFMHRNLFTVEILKRLYKLIICKSKTIYVVLDLPLFAEQHFYFSINILNAVFLAIWTVYNLNNFMFDESEIEKPSLSSSCVLIYNTAFSYDLDFLPLQFFINY